MSDQTDPRGEDEFLLKAYGLTDLTSAMAFYSEWAGEYDDRMEGVLGYVAPRLMADLFACHADGADAAVLDVGCGTGLTSSYLVSHGFKIIDGVDLNPRMLQKAGERKLYRELVQADITQPINLASASYDGIISSGTFTLGHVGSEPLPELIRLLKPGGVLGCSVHKEIWSRDGFEHQFAEFQANGEIEVLERQSGEFFSGYGETAWYCVFRKC